MEETREALIIKKVKGFECLYNPYLSDYKNIEKRQELWSDIGKQVNMSGIEAKDCWGKLRRCLSNSIHRQSNKLKKHKKAKKWKHEDQMAFLLPFMETKTKDQNDCCNTVTSSVPDVSSSSIPNISLVETFDTSVETNTEPRCYSESSPATDHHDDVDMFFLNMAKMTKQLPKVEQSRIKLEISNLVLNAEIEQQMLYSKPIQQSFPAFEEIHPFNGEQYHNYVSL